MTENKDEKPKYTYEQLKEKCLDEKKAVEKEKNTTKQFAQDYQMIVSFMLTLIILILGGVFLGKYLDEKLNTSPLFILLFTFLGIAASYRNLFKDASKNDKGSKKK
jgi:ATP synthase protein I